jgi:hypothetical protein
MPCREKHTYIPRSNRRRTHLPGAPGVPGVKTRSQDCNSTSKGDDAPTLPLVVGALISSRSPKTSRWLF